jgi:hypothetical protein
LGPGEKPPRFNFVVESSIWGQARSRHGFNFVIDSSIWGQARSRHGSTLSSTRLFGARREAVTVQLCHRLVYLGPGEKPPRFNFVIDSSSWGQARSRHGSTLSSTRLFGARREATTVQLCRRIVYLGPGEKPSRFNFVIDSSIWGQARSRHGSTLSSTRLFGARREAATVQLCRRLVYLGLVQDRGNSRTTKKPDFSNNSDFLAQSIRLFPKSVVLTGGMKISALLH